MSKNKRIKSHNSKGKKDTAAKDAVKKRKTESRASKFKNVALKAKLDSQAHLLYQMTEAPPPTLPSAEANIHDLAAVLGNL